MNPRGRQAAALRIVEDGDHGARLDFDELLGAHQRRIYFFIRAMVFDPEEAKDVLQDVNMIVLLKRGRFEPGTDFKSWAFAIARFECLNWLKRRERSVAAAERMVALADLLADRAEGRAEEAEGWLTALEECRRALPEESARLLALRYQHRVPLEEVAERWKTSEGSLKQKLLRIRHRLKRCVMARRAAANPEDDRNADDESM